MALIQFTRNHTDHSTDKGFQFEFFCDRCGNGFTSEFQTSVTGLASSALRAAGNLFGGVLGGASSSAYEIERAVLGPAHDKAFRAAVEEAKPNFRQCPKCSHWVCQATCWNAKRSLCYECAPDIETELAAAQVQTTVEQLKDKLRNQDLTKNLDLTSEAAARVRLVAPAPRGRNSVRSAASRYVQKPNAPAVAQSSKPARSSVPNAARKSADRDCGNMSMWGLHKELAYASGYVSTLRLLAVAVRCVGR